MSLSRRKITIKVDLLLRGHVTPDEKAEAMDLAMALRHLNSGTVSATLQWLYMSDAPLSPSTLEAVIAALDDDERPTLPVPTKAGSAATVNLFDSFFDDE